MGRSIALINKELNYLETAYNRLMIKTVDYREEKEKLLKEKEKLIKMSDAELAKTERNTKIPKESSLTRKFSDPNGGATIPKPLVIDDDIEDHITL